VMRRPVTLILMALAVMATAAQAADLDRHECLQLLAEASDLFRRANEAAADNPQDADDLYSQAIMRYERIILDGGVRNGKLYYNLGNAYFRKGELGRAILNYRVAEQLIPNDSNLKKNLQFARSKCIDSIAVKEKTRILKTLFFWHYDLSSKTRGTLFVVSFALLWVGASVRLFVRRPGLLWLIGLAAALAVLAAGSLFYEEIDRSRNVEAVVLAEEVVARKGDGETYQPSFTEPLHAGTEVWILQDRRDWRHVELSDGRRCWLPGKSLAIIQ